MRNCKLCKWEDVDGICMIGEYPNGYEYFEIAKVCFTCKKYIAGFCYEKGIVDKYDMCDNWEEK